MKIIGAFFMTIGIIALLMVAFVAIIGGYSQPAHAAALPECDHAQVRETLANMQARLLEAQDAQGGDGKRWCSARIIQMIGMRAQYQNVLFTIEWMNEADGRFWVEIKQRQVTTCNRNEQRCY